MTTNTYQALCYDVKAYEEKLKTRCDTCRKFNSLNLCNDSHSSCTKLIKTYPPQSAEQRERLLCLALNTYRDMLADINDIEIMTPENLFTASLEWIQIGLKESVLSKEEVKDCLIGK